MPESRTRYHRKARKRSQTGRRRQKNSLARKLKQTRSLLPPGQASRSNKFSSSGVNWETVADGIPILPKTPRKSVKPKRSLFRRLLG